MRAKPRARTQWQAAGRVKKDLSRIIRQTAKTSEGKTGRPGAMPDLVWAWLQMPG